MTVFERIALMPRSLIQLDPRHYAICLVDEASYYDLPFSALCVLSQRGNMLSLVVEKTLAQAAGLICHQEWACIKVADEARTRAGRHRWPCQATLLTCLLAAGLNSQMIAGYGYGLYLVLWQHRHDAQSILQGCLSGLHRGRRLLSRAA